MNSEYVNPTDGFCDECKSSFGVHLVICSKFKPQCKPHGIPNCKFCPPAAPPTGEGTPRRVDRDRDDTERPQGCPVCHKPYTYIQGIFRPVRSCKCDPSAPPVAGTPPTAEERELLYQQFVAPVAGTTVEEDWGKIYVEEIRGSKDPIVRLADSIVYGCTIVTPHTKEHPGLLSNETYVKEVRSVVEKLRPFIPSQPPADEITRLRTALEKVLAIPAVSLVIGTKHTKECGCSVCEARKVIAELAAPVTPVSQPEPCNAEIADSRAVRFLSEYPPEKFSSSREMLRNFAFWLGYFTDTSIQQPSAQPTPNGETGAK